MNDKIHGQGVNDIRGFQDHPLFAIWKQMLEDCYGPGKLSVQAGGTSVWPAWLIASNFLEWAESRWAPGLGLNLGLLKPGNMQYCPDMCCFITQEVQKAIEQNDSSWVWWCRNAKKFVAHGPESTHRYEVGTFDTFKAAKDASLDARIAYLNKLATKQENGQVRQGLVWFASALENSR